ncbi:MEDS domain-containing protein [Halorarum salinum]|uniref:MEDS domain-containing protein n=1 Tax=Halorarum salinum TaxID=2743089 RepID=A0A7D5LDW9_9EURY|nr:MEDS domain-containing protein [Halobaculum salinum]QLG63695.1 MEDS domain-containing protein [Halobaculum salinum]
MDPAPSEFTPSRGTDAPSNSGGGDRDATEDALHHHTALLYGNQRQQFDAVVPIVRDGLERGERCLYICDDNDEEAVTAAMRAAGIDVEAAVEAGDLSVHSAEDPFLSDGEFEPADTVEFATDAIREATEVNGYDAVRIVGEMTWVLDGEHSLDHMVEYEHELNDVFGSRPVTGVCQYNVSRFDPELLNQIIRAHPTLVYDGTVGRDFYYVPENAVGGESGSASDDGPGGTLLERVSAFETLERRERALSALNDATEELMGRELGNLPERAADVVRQVLDVPFASVWRYDGATGDLELDATSADPELGTAGGDGRTVTPLAERYRDRAWNAFVTGETEVHADPSTASDRAAPNPRLRSGVIVPLGRHGVFCAETTRPDGVDDPLVDLANTVGTTLTAALDRADREETLAEQNEQLERLNRINRVIRGIGEALVDADTRAEIERLVCERLAASDPYEFVWIGDLNREDDAITPRATAGDRDGYLDDVGVTSGEGPTGRGPIRAAVEDRSVQVVQDVLIEPAFEPWRESTLEHDLRSCISVPLAYEESCYGSLTLYAASPNVFDDLERSVLGELGETIAHAIEAVETRRALLSDAVTELTIAVDGTDDVLADLARVIDAELAVDGFVGDPAEPARVFFTIPGVDPDGVLDRSESLPGLSDVRVEGETDAGHAFSATVSGPTLASRVVDNHAAIRSLGVTADGATAVVDLPVTSSVRSFLEALRASYPTVELVARRNRDRSMRTRRDVREAVADRLTDRQREVLETAYLSGFFESPRARTGRELSRTLDVSQSTFSHHLREAERKVFELVLDYC